MSKGKFAYFVVNGAAGFVGAIGGPGAPEAPEGDQSYARIEALIPPGWLKNGAKQGQSLDEFWKTEQLKTRKLDVPIKQSVNSGDCKRLLLP